MAIRRASGELVCVYAVGNIEAFPSGVDPNKLYVGTTWVRIKGRVLVGVDESQNEFSSVNKTGGSKAETLTVNQIPSHEHDMPKGMFYWSASGHVFGNTGSWTNALISDYLKTGTTGGGQAHNNLQPYVTKYLWERTA